MQNFTFGRKGTNWFLFAFIMLIGTLPSFGQTCPTTGGTDAEQTFCYLETVGDISTDGDAIYQTADNENDTQPIPSGEVLSSGTYWAGSTSGDCNRIEVAVTVNSEQRPVNNITNSRSPGFEFTSCASEDFNAGDLASLFEADLAYSIEVYDSEFGTTPMNSTDNLQGGESYFVGQVPTAGEDAENDVCASLRTAVRFNPITIEGPTATTPQTFCESATVADLEATGTYDNTQAIRWYRSLNANEPLSESTELIDGQTYYAAQVVNDSDSPAPPCETPAADRTAVTVELVEGPDAGVQEGDGIVCESDVEEIFPSNDAVRNFYLSLLEDGVPADGTFNPTIDQIVDQYQNDEDGLGEFTTTYTIGEDNCTDSVDLTITIIAAEEAEAGDDFSSTYCVDQDENFDLYSFLSDDAIETGEFSAPFEDGVFNPSEEGAGTYTITYSVNEDNSCVNGSDEATFTLEVNEVSEENITIDIDPSELEGMTEEEILNDLVDRFSPFFDGVPDENAFDPQLEVAFAELDPENPEGTYQVSYNGNSCEILNFTVVIEEVDLQEPECPNLAGTDSLGVVCEADVQETFPSIDEIRKYYLNLLDEGVSRDGTFDPTPTEIADQYQNDEDGLGDFTTTYTVSNDECTDSVQLTVRIVEDVDAGEDGSVTLNEDDEPVNLFDFLEGTPDEGGTWSPGNGTFDPATDEPGDYTYTIGTESCEDSAIVTVTVTSDPTDPTEPGCAGEDAIGEVCITDVEETFPSIDEIRKYYLSLLDEGVATDGTFNPTPAEIANQYQNDEDGLGDFTTTYTLANEDCEDSTELTVRIIDTEPADAGEIDDQTVCSNEGMIDLSDYLEGSGAVEGGTFTGEGVDDGMFDSSIGSNEDGYTITYTVSEDNDACVTGEASTSFVIEVIDSADAGEDNSTIICNQDILDGMFEGSETILREFYLDLLDEGVSREGTFSPSLQEFIDQYDSGNQIGTFTTTYTVGEGQCPDSVELSVTVKETVEADAGEIEDQTVCSSDADIDLFTYLSDDANKDGVFEGYEDGIFSPSMVGAGSFEITYTVGEDIPCVEGEASTTFTIEVQQGAHAGEDMEVNICSNDGLQDLFSFISADADMDGEFTLDGEVIAEGIMDPSAFEVGTYEVIYSVMVEDGECGEDDMATITITLGEAPEAPTTNESVAFCAIDGETAARLEAEGTNLTWYSDADLTMMVSEEDVLVNGEYYVTQSSDNGCESDAAMIMVNIVDSPAPTISSDYELCEFDDPTIADLTAEINESGEVTWYDSAQSMTALSNNAMLNDGTTYYATLISDNGCESSERLAVTVTLEDCALLFPEAITPNGDGRNDRFVIENIEREYPNYNITIFNRWGNAVYKGNASTPTWDGTANQSGSLGDDVLPVGVYFYVVDFNDGSTSPRQGKVYLNR
ncbi:gliding motility-associated C-terminal domain-containing protein [Salegentibacter sp. JZCK2]|uniref:gliding motility-associated C-terminal domain-containing protein n=1 Tax=Salegentibacter tibetensis TaxID=2873600 RepID=UPI001CCE8472|nr:gliding motility-associated C-terminal domain-containing protein [Salegentibacter tibetensis]MBZ9728450.1 gliding motility-associated C-terminal domain-containing protein [Salegentibacter tibetensis]